MKKQPDVTIIVTVHNAEKYLRACVQSAMQQAHDNIEIICIDGGSKDSSPEILRLLQSEDNRILIINDENTSYGHKVNVGIERAHGKYITILESDDCLPQNAVRSMLQAADIHDADIISGDYKFVFDYNGKKVGFVYNKFADDYYDRLFDFTKDKRFYLYGGITGSLFKRDFLLAKNIRLNETPGASFQDQGFGFLTNLLSQSHYNIKEPVYYYTIDNPNSSVVDDNKILEIIYECDFMEQQLRDRGIREKDIWENFYNHKYEMYINKLKNMGEKGKQVFKHAFLKSLLMDEKKSEFGDIKLKNTTRQELESFKSDNSYFDGCHASVSMVKRMILALDIISNNEVVLIGAGKIASQIMMVAREAGIVLKCVCDNSLSKCGKEFYGYSIQSVEQVAMESKDCKYLVSTPMNFHEIKMQLMELGITERNIICY